jgi:hypothetical protein
MQSTAALFSCLDLTCAELNVSLRAMIHSMHKFIVALRWVTGSGCLGVSEE